MEMYGLRRFGIKLELGTICSMLEGLGRPQEKFESIHVAGTNGKGSIAAMLSSILHRAGYRVGRYTSPHLISFNERITINNRQIDNDEVVAAYQAVRKQPGGDRQPTFFEYTTAMAFYIFARREVEVAVIETGMGGRFDATNVIVPKLSIISNISGEHQMYLGRTLADIANEKAGIIKPDIPLVTGVTQKKARDKIIAVADSRGAPVYRLGSHFCIRRNPSDGFSYFGINGTAKGLRTNLAGRHQHKNAALALAACELLNTGEIAVSETAVRQGLADTHWPGRLEIVTRRPLILIDGAHNLMAARGLAGYLAENLKDRPLTLVIGILDDKSYRSILKTLIPLCRRVIVTRAQTGRAIEPEKLRQTAVQMTSRVTVAATVPEAIDQGLAAITPDEALCIAGSLYVAGEARHTLIQKELLAE